MSIIAGNSDIHDRSLIQIGDWHLVKSGFPVGVGRAVFAVHTGCAPTSWNALPGQSDLVCFRCGDTVPDELQALVVLHAWGRKEQ